jgi:hypothetical protein
MEATKYYTKEELIKKFKGKFIDTYPHHHEYWNDKLNRYETVYEVRKVSRTIRENFETPEEVIGHN